MPRNASRLFALLLLILGMFAPAASAGVPIVNQATVEYKENFEPAGSSGQSQNCCIVGSIPSESGVYATTQVGGGSRTVQTVAFTGFGTQALGAFDNGAAYAAQISNTATGVNLCTAGQVFIYDFVPPSMAAGTILELRNTGAAVASSSRPIDTFGLYVTQIDSTHDGIQFYIHGHTGATQTSATAISVATATPLHVVVSGVSCTATASATFTITGNGAVTMTAAAADTISGTISRFELGTTTWISGTNIVYLDNYDWQGIAHAAPTISSISPSSGSTAGGVSFTLTGTGFYNGPCTPTVKFGATNLATSVTVASTTSITGITPAGTAGSATVTITNCDAQTATTSYTYSNTAPTISSLSPNNGPVAGGNVVTITGTNFATTGTTAVKFGSTPGTAIAVQSPTSLTVTVPAASAPVVVDVIITNPDAQTVTSTGGYTYGTPNSNSPPTVTSLSPNVGSINGGNVVVLTGTNFWTTGTTAVMFGSKSAPTVNVQSSTKISVVVPVGTTTGAVTVQVTNPNAQFGTLASGYTYVAQTNPPTATAVSPNHGPKAGGTLVTITGAGFYTINGALPTVTFGSSLGTGVFVASASSLTVTAPVSLNSGSVNVVVANPDGQSGTIANGFLYDAVAGGTATTESFTSQNVGQVPAGWTYSGGTPPSGPAGLVQNCPAGAAAARCLESMGAAGMYKPSGGAICSGTAAGTYEWTVFPTPLRHFSNSIGTTTAIGGAPTINVLGFPTNTAATQIEFSMSDSSSHSAFDIFTTPPTPLAAGQNLHFSLVCQVTPTKTMHLTESTTSLDVTGTWGLTGWSFNAFVMNGATDADFYLESDISGVPTAISFDQSLPIASLPGGGATTLVGFDVDNTGTTGIMRWSRTGVSTGNTVSTFAAGTMQASQTYEDTNCMRTQGVSALPTIVSYIKCDSTTHLSNQMSLRSASLGDPTIPTVCQQGDFCEFNIFSDTLNNADKNLEVQDIKSYPFDFSKIDTSGTVNDVSMAWAISTTDGKMGVLTHVFRNNAGDRSWSTYDAINPAGSTPQQICTSFDVVKLKDYITGASSNANVAQDRIDFTRTTDTILNGGTDFTASLTRVFSGVTGTNNPVGVDCSLDKFIVVSSSGKITAWKRTNDLPTLLWTANVGSSNVLARGVAMSADTNFAAYINGTFLDVVYVSNGTRTAHITAPSGMTSLTFLGLKLDGNGKQLWEGQNSGVFHYSIAAYTTGSDLPYVDPLQNPDVLQNITNQQTSTAPPTPGSAGGNIFRPAGAEIPAGFTAATFDGFLAIIFMAVMAALGFFLFGKSPAGAAIFAFAGFLIDYFGGLISEWVVLFLAFAMIVACVFGFLRWRGNAGGG